MNREQFLWLNRSGVKRIFPRRALELWDNNGRLHVLNDDFSLFSYIKDRSGIDVYVQVFSSWQIMSRMFDTILIDIDAHGTTESIFDAYDKYLKVVDAIENFGVKVSRQYFTGRGFHVYIDFPIANLEFYRKDCKQLVIDLGIDKYVDMNVIGDFTRSARFVDTVNSKTNTVVRRFGEVDVVDILSGEYGKPKYFVNKKLMDIIIEYDAMFYVREHHREKPVSIVDNEFWKRNKDNIDILPQCIRDGIEILIKTGELSHYWRLLIAMFLLRAWGYYKTLKVFENASDFSLSKTKYHLDYIINNRLYVYSCKKINDELGICPFYGRQHKCPFYPSMNRFLPDWDDVLGDAE